LKYRGESRRMIRKYNLAFIDLNEANKLKPNDFYILNVLGLTQIQLGNLENAIKNLKKSLELKPNNSFTFTIFRIPSSRIKVFSKYLFASYSTVRSFIITCS